MKNLNQKISTVGATSSRPILQRQDLKQSKGITLIALVITIIVLLILAGVTINMLTGDSGILKNAKYASFATRVRAVEEQLELKMIANIENIENRENMNYTNWTGGATTGTIKEIIPEIENDLAKILAIEDGYLIFTEEATKEEKEMLLSLNIYGESIKIRTAEELRQIATQVQNGRTYENEKIKLMNDIDLGATWDEEGNLLTGTAWTPIGTYAGTWVVEDTENSREFKGIFEGNNYTIKNMYISQESGIGTGLFAYCGESSVIKNVQLGDGYIKSYSETGGIAGRTKGTIENCINNGTTINSNSNVVGGIVGRSFGSIKNCKNFAQISALANAGGISGAAGIKENSHPGGEIINCENNGDIILKITSYDQNSTSGGIVSNIYRVKLSGCINTGNIYAKGKTLGGIVGGFGEVSGNSIENCKNYGDITGSYYVGGIIGYCRGVDENNKVKITNCINEGSITATGDALGSDGLVHLNVGGIAGNVGYTEIYACNNKGNVTGPYGGWVGGIVGDTMYSKVSQCVNEGYILGKSTDIGGVSGVCDNNSIISNSYNKGGVESITSMASGISGIVGWDTPGEVYNCYNIGTIIRLYSFYWLKW